MAEERAPQGPAGTAGDAEAMARLQEQINNLPVSEHLLFMLHSLSALAIDRLGLSPEAAARRDPGQARMAIDAFKSLLDVLEPERPAAEVAAYRGTLSQLQMAFVGALGAGAATAQPDAAAAEPPTAAEPLTATEPAAPTDEPPASAPASAPRPKAAPKKAAKPRTSAKSGARSAKE
jgi:hypothetical protein